MSKISNKTHPSPNADSRSTAHARYRKSPRAAQRRRCAPHLRPRPLSSSTFRMETAVPWWPRFPTLATHFFPLPLFLLSLATTTLYPATSHFTRSLICACRALLRLARARCGKPSESERRRQQTTRNPPVRRRQTNKENEKKNGGYGQLSCGRTLALADID